MRDGTTENPRKPANQSAGYATAVVVGLVASSFHWSGLLLGGVLVGLLSPTLRRGVVYGAGFGLLTWIVFATLFASKGIVPTADGAEIFGVSIAIAVILGGVGGSARELRPLLGSVTPWSGG